MQGPYSIDELEKFVYELVVASKARAGEAFPAKFVYSRMIERVSHDDFSRATRSLEEKGLITNGGRIASDFFSRMSPNSSHIREDGQSGPFSLREIEGEIYKLILQSKARAGDAFPVRFVLGKLDKTKLSRKEFDAGISSYVEKGWITDDDKISEPVNRSV